MSEYFWMLGFLLLGRGADLVSTYVVTPDLSKEANPIAKKLGWKWGIIVNVIVCLLFAFSTVCAVMIATASFLVSWTNLFKTTKLKVLLWAVTGIALIVLSNFNQIALGTGTGMISYCVAMFRFREPSARGRE